MLHRIFLGMEILIPIFCATAVTAIHITKPFFGSVNPFYTTYLFLDRLKHLKTRVLGFHFDLCKSSKGLISLQQNKTMKALIQSDSTISSNTT